MSVGGLTNCQSWKTLPDGDIRNAITIKTSR
jgi:hypothetical protein